MPTGVDDFRLVNDVAATDTGFDVRPNDYETLVETDVLKDRRNRWLDALAQAKVSPSFAAAHVAINVTGRVSHSLRRVRVDARLVSTNAATSIARSLCRVRASVCAAVSIGSHLLRVRVIAARITISATVRIVHLCHFSSVAAVYVAVAAARVGSSLRRACANAVFHYVHIAAELVVRRCPRASVVTGRITIIAADRVVRRFR